MFVLESLECFLLPLGHSHTTRQRSSCGMSEFIFELRFDFFLPRLTLRHFFAAQEFDLTVCFTNEQNYFNSDSGIGNDDNRKCKKKKIFRKKKMIYQKKKKKEKYTTQKLLVAQTFQQRRRFLWKRALCGRQQIVCGDDERRKKKIIFT